jgi:uridine phosphorylase
MTKVLRSMPRTFLPYRSLSLIGQELEWKLLLEVCALRGAAAGVVLGVEAEDQAFPALAGEAEGAAAGAGKTDFGHRLAERFQRF